ncbi:MAG: chemotaxis response regulator protein-glutamate methylesterase [Gammaproteobacteria bacterium]|nr:chemotaxis response regulator protein-glutamate methylesterase [Gammaproteobacteria bacterium]
MPVKVLIVDDSALVQQMLSKILGSDPGIQVVGVAPDPYVARDMIKKLNPDVLTLDVEMPRMNGIAFLENLMRLRPMSVVMVSSLIESGAEVTLKALELGAVDYFPKDQLEIACGSQGGVKDILGMVKAAAGARVRALDERKRINKEAMKRYTLEPGQVSNIGFSQLRFANRIIGLGASTGGTEAIADVLQYLPAGMPGIVITQHILDNFSKSFAMRLNANSGLNVVEAVDGQKIIPGHVYLAPDGRHLMVEREGLCHICRLDDGPLCNRHKPSVDVMFKSLAKSVGSNAIGVIMTGMGEDGAVGLSEMKQSGAATLAQDEMSSVIWGMPGSAIKRGCVDEVVSLRDISQRLIELSISS